MRPNGMRVIEYLSASARSMSEKTLQEVIAELDRKYGKEKGIYNWDEKIQNTGML